MAVVFISPKQRQKTFFMAITAGFLLFVMIIAFLVFFAPIKTSSPALVFNKPKITINTEIFKSQQFLDLQPIPSIEMQFFYKALTEKNKSVQGYLSAASKEDATKVLLNLKYTIVELKEAEIGRDNPFTPYYQSQTSTLNNTSTTKQTSSTTK